MGQGPDITLVSSSKQPLSSSKYGLLSFSCCVELLSSPCDDSGINSIIESYRKALVLIKYSIISFYLCTSSYTKWIGKEDCRVLTKRENNGYYIGMKCRIAISHACSYFHGKIERCDANEHQKFVWIGVKR